jgi:arylsulfatase A-like enzyme
MIFLQLEEVMRALCLMVVIMGSIYSPAISRAAEKANVLILYADDLGWGELGCQGNKEIATPHIDSLAQHGVRCTQGYVAATYCSPSRAGLMTGRYPTRFGHEFNGVANANGPGLSLKETTLADRMRELGYATCCVGKWHLGEDMEHRPTKRGFDEFYGTLNNTPFFQPTKFVDSRISLDVQPKQNDDFYTTDAYADRAVDWLEKNKAKPWFLYLPFNAQHAPLQAPKKYLDRFQHIADEKRRIFAAMLSSMDDAVGRVLTKVREMQQEENTLIFFIGDNGGPTPSTTSGNGPLRGFKMTTYEGGPRVPFLVQWKGKLPAGKNYDFPVMNLDVLPTAVAAGNGKVEANWQIDGTDLRAYLAGEKQDRPHDALFWRYGEQWAVRQGDWKLVVSKGGTMQPELYHLADDIAEAKNLADSQPEKVKTLQALYDTWNKEQAEPTVKDGSPMKAKNKGKKKIAL